jgi:hypothetical protein
MKIVARLVDSLIAAARAPCRVKCSVVTKATAVGCGAAPPAPVLAFWSLLVFSPAFRGRSGCDSRSNHEGGVWCRRLLVVHPCESSESGGYNGALRRRMQMLSRPAEKGLRLSHLAGVRTCAGSPPRALAPACSCPGRRTLPWGSRPPGPCTWRLLTAGAVRRPSLVPVEGGGWRVASNQGHRERPPPCPINTA